MDHATADRRSFLVVDAGNGWEILQLADLDAEFQPARIADSCAW